MLLTPPGACRRALHHTCLISPHEHRDHDNVLVSKHLMATFDPAQHARSRRDDTRVMEELAMAIKAKRLFEKNVLVNHTGTVGKLRATTVIVYELYEFRREGVMRTGVMAEAVATCKRLVSGCI